MSVWELWLPMLVAGIATHILSTIAWTVSPHHRPEWKPLPLGDGLGDALDSRGVAAGEQYLLNEGAPQGEDDKSWGMDPAKCRGMLIMWPHRPHMGKNIGMTLAYFFFCAFAIGYLASVAFEPGAPAMDLFRFTATAGLLTHMIGGAPTIIWFRRKFVMDWIDGGLYALATRAAFALLWPK